MFNDHPSRHEFNELLRRFNHFKEKTMSDIDTINAALADTEARVVKLKAVNTLLLNSYGTLAAQIAALKNAGNGSGVIAPTDLAALLAHIGQVNAAVDAVSADDTAAVAPAADPAQLPLPLETPVDPAPAADPVAVVADPAAPAA